MKNYVHDFGNLSCLIRETINIENWDVMWEGLSVHLFRMNEISVDETSGYSIIQEGLNGVEFTCVHGSNFYQQEQESLLHVQGANREELGQSLLLLGSMEQSNN